MPGTAVEPSARNSVPATLPTESRTIVAGTCSPTRVMSTLTRPVVASVSLTATISR